MRNSIVRRLLLVPALLAILVFSGFSDKPESATAPTDWTVDKAHTQVKFKVRHLGLSNVEGSFNTFDLTLNFDPEDLTTLKTTATIDVASIDTGNERRDNHLRSDDFFAAEQHPQMTFVSREVRNVEGNRFQIAGDLTIRGTTKPVVLDAEMLGTAAMQGKTVAAFTATTTINRFDYGLKWDRLTEAGGLVVGEDVQITIDVEAVQESPQG